MFSRFTERARRVVVLAREEAERFHHEYLGTEHLLLGIIKDGGGVAIAVLQRLGIDLKYLKNEFERNFPVTSNMLVVGDIPFTARAKKVLEYAIEDARSMGHSYIGTEHLLLGLMREKDSVAYRVLTGCGLRYEKMREETLALLREPMSSTKEKANKTPALDEFGRDLTALAADGQLDPVIGRNNEIERMIQILSRRRKNNPVLIGEPGVGKTAIVEGLARKIISRNIPELLYDKRVISLDLGSMIAGTKYRGQFEGRLKAVMKEITQSNDIILFIDELHTLVGAGAAEGSMDGSNMLKPALSRGEIQCIGATTIDEYRRYIEKNGALERRFQPITVNPPSIEEAIEIIRGLKEEYETHHKAKISDSSIIASVKLSDRYISDRFLPDKAIDVIDEAASRVHLKKLTHPTEIQEKHSEIDKVIREKRERIEAQEFEKAVELRDREESLKKELEVMKQKWEKTQEMVKPVVTEEDIAFVISRVTGIPLYRIEKAETQRLLELEKMLSKSIIGQDMAINVVSRAIRRSRAGLKDITKPMGTFLFLGPTGVGKTELAHVVAEHLFEDRSSIIRLDMSEYMERYSASKMIGAPPGYVGFDDGGQLTEKVRRRPYSVVLFDEIEKAHHDIFHMLLQVMDDGRLTDSSGRVVDFRNVILIMTSNLSARSLEKGITMGFQKEDLAFSRKRYEAGVKAELKKAFTPEFLNRIDEVVVFNPLSKEHIDQIVYLMVSDLNRRLFEEGFFVDIDNSVYSWLAQKGYDPASGARGLKRIIQNKLTDPLSEEILFGNIKNGKIRIEIRDNELIISTKIDKGWSMVRGLTPHR